MAPGLAQAKILADAEAAFAAAADDVLARAAAAIAERGRFHIALAGGSTPARLYRLLAAAESDWSRWEVWFGDERCVPPGHADSNYRMARETLLDAVPIPAQQLHPLYPDPALSPADAAHAYAGLLRAALPDQGAGPRLDLALLGLGDDGHTASLFPHTAVLGETEQAARAVYVERLDSWRITLTLPTLNAARALSFLVVGDGKAEILRRLRNRSEGAALPVELLEPRGEVHWFLDQAASGPGGEAVCV
jgi:6-phosphogluconolactonase